MGSEDEETLPRQGTPSVTSVEKVGSGELPMAHRVSGWAHGPVKGTWPSPFQAQAGWGQSTSIGSTFPQDHFSLSVTSSVTWSGLTGSFKNLSLCLMWSLLVTNFSKSFPQCCCQAPLPHSAGASGICLSNMTLGVETSGFAHTIWYEHSECLGACLIHCCSQIISHELKCARGEG